MLLTGTEYEVAHDGERLRIARQTPDGPMTLIDVPLAQVLTVEGGLYATDPDAEAPEGAILAISFVDPTLTWEGERLDWAPVHITFDLDRAEEVDTALDELNLGLQRVRRRRLPLPDVTPPVAVAGPQGPQRPDVTEAANRVVSNRRQLRRLDLVHAETRPDEFVLEIAPTKDCYLVATTLRIHRVFYDGLRVVETPVDGICSTDLEDFGRHGAGVTLDLGLWFSRLPATAHEDARRLRDAVEFAMMRRLRQDAYASVQPDPCAMSRHWESLREQFQLGAVTEEEFRAQAAGILQVAW